MLNADVHLLLLRPTRVPIAGEAVSEGFQGQVELDGWTWSFHNEEEKKKSDEREKEYSDRRTFIDSRGGLDIRQKIEELKFQQSSSKSEGSYKKSRQAAYDEFDDVVKRLNEGDMKPDKRQKALEEAERVRDKALDSADAEWDKAQDSERKNYDKALRKLVDANYKEQTEYENERDRKIAEQLESLEKKAAEADRNKNFEFTFSKRVDIATTQLLNSMKAGDVFPTGVMTIHQRSTNASMSLVFNLQRVRLLDYALKCETSETMTTMREEWTCEFGALGYVYKSKDMVYLSSSLSQNVPRAMTQGQVRAFTMKSTKLKI